MKKLTVTLVTLILCLAVQAQLRPIPVTEEEQRAGLAFLDSIAEAWKYTPDDLIEDIESMRSDQNILDWSLDEVEALILEIENSDSSNTNRCELTTQFAFKWYESFFVEVDCRQRARSISLNPNEEDCPQCQGLADSAISGHERWYEEYQLRRQTLLERAIIAMPQYAGYLEE